MRLTRRSALATGLAGLAGLACPALVNAATSELFGFAANHIRPEALSAAAASFVMHQTSCKRRELVSIIDYGLPSHAPRFHILDVQQGSVASLLVAHGRGSDPDHDGRATQFSNEHGSYMSSLGSFLTGSEYLGRHGRSLRLIGLDPTNDQAVSRSIVLHGADYVASGRRILGRSHGCPAIDPALVDATVTRLKDGTFLFAFAD